MHRLLIAALVSLAVVPAGCAGAAGKSSILHPASGQPTTSTSAGGKDVTADKAAAVSAALTLRDLPPGWTSKPRTGDTRAATAQADAAACLGVPAALLSTHTPASSDSPDFTSPDGSETISSNVSYLATVDAARARFSLIDGPKVPECMGGALRDIIERALAHPASGAHSSTLPAGVKVGTPTFRKMPFPSVGDETSAYRFELPITYAGRSVTFQEDLVFVRRGRAGINLSFEWTAATPSTEQEQHYTEVVVARLASAAAPS